MWAPRWQAGSQRSRSDRSRARSGVLKCGSSYFAAPSSVLWFGIASRKVARSTLMIESTSAQCRAFSRPESWLRTFTGDNRGNRGLISSFSLFPPVDCCGESRKITKRAKRVRIPVGSPSILTNPYRSTCVKERTEEQRRPRQSRRNFDLYGSYRPPNTCGSQD